MSDLTDYARDLLSRALCGRLPALPVAIHAALGTGRSAQGLDGEPAGTGYARQRVVFNGFGEQRSTSALRFTFTTAAGPLTHVGLFDAAFGGNLLFITPLAEPIRLAGSSTIDIAPGSLQVTVY